MGYLVGSNEGGSSGGGGGDNTGCGCLAIILIAVVSILGMMFTFFTKLMPSLYESFLNLYEKAIVKVVLFPSTFDFLFEWEGSYYTRGLILLVGFVLLMVLMRMVRKAPWFINLFLFMHLFILLVRIIGTFLFALSVTFLGENNLFVEDKTELQITEKNASITGAITPTNYFEYTEETDDVLMTDVEGNGSHDKFLWINFLAPDSSNTMEERSIQLDIEPKSTFYYEGVIDSDEFRTIISYAPTDKESEWKNQSVFTIEFLVNEKNVKTVSLSPKNPVMPITIPLKDAEEFIISVNGNVMDRSIVTFLSPTFSADF